MTGKRKSKVALASGKMKHVRMDFAIPTANRFGALGSLRPTPNQSTVKQPTAQARPAPLVVTEQELSPLLKAIEEKKLSHSIKLLSVGAKIFVDNTNDRGTLTELLDDLKLNYYSHPGASEKLIKLVLSGLPEISTDIISNWLKEKNNISPVKISMLNTESSNKLYLLQFDQNQVSKADIVNIRVINHHIVRWLPFIRKSRGPTQCYNCGMFGHGISFCHRQSACFNCGEAHSSNTCPFLGASSQDHLIYKCINCFIRKLPHNHRCDDNECPSRLRYVELKNQSNPKNRTVKTNQIHRNNDGRNNVIQNNKKSVLTHTTERLVPPVLTRTYAQAVRHGDRTHPSENGANNDSSLWTFSEVSEILLSCINDLTKCRTKIDQVRVIAKLLNNAIN